MELFYWVMLLYIFTYLLTLYLLQGTVVIKLLYFDNNMYSHTETQLLRKVAPVYSDGSYEPSGEDRPPPMNVSRVVFVGDTGFPSYRNRTAFMVFFGKKPL